MDFKALLGKKSAIRLTMLTEGTRDAVNKSYIPKFLYKPPFGYPRYEDISYIRYLAKTPYVDMCITTIVDEIASIEWDIIPMDGMEEYVNESEIQQIKRFFRNPNTNYESFEDVFIRMPVRDMLEINSGVLNKVFNMKGEMCEVVTRDGATFTKNPDIHGMFTYRADIMLPNQIVQDNSLVINPYYQISAEDARKEAAYFQYGWISGPVPTPFGRKEIIWLEKTKRSDDLYGQSPIQILSKSLQMLQYMIEGDKDYYDNNNMPKGVLGFEALDSEDIEAIKQQWNNATYIKDDFGNLKRQLHQVPMVNRIPKFERLEFTSTEMQFIEKQRWYTKMVWATFGVTSVELGYTEDAKGSANQIVQSKTFTKKAILPILARLEFAYTNQIINEFGFNVNVDGFERQKYQFVFKKSDTDDERNRYELYKLQAETGIKTINEIRTEEGLEPVGWGDKPLSQQNVFGMNPDGTENFDKRQQDAQDTDEDMDEPETEEKSCAKKKELDTKPFAGVEGKAETTNNNPLILGEGEKPTEARLERAIKYVLSESEKKIIDMLEDEKNKFSITEIKDINSIIDKIKALLGIAALKEITYSVIKNVYLDGWEQSEKEMDKNFMPDQDAINYLNDYTFDNIKGMSDDIADKLRQELQRGFMQGEGIPQIKERVKSVFDVGDNRAEMIARTETNRASNSGRLHAYKASGIKATKVWISAKDERTSELCRRLDGQVVGIDEPFRDPKGEWEGQAPPSHVQCRSTIGIRPLYEKD